MVGLLVKDIRLMLGQKKFFIVVALLSAFFVISGDDPALALNYCTILCAFFTVNTISYDEFNHGFSFLFTLPISRKEYVLEKYLYGLIIGGTAWLVIMLFGAGYYCAADTAAVMSEWLETSVGTLLGLGIFLCLLLPVQLKYGVEKGRTALLVITIVIFGVVGLFMKNGQALLALQTKLQWIETMDEPIAVLAGVLALALLAVVSISVSIHIVEKKQF